MSNIKEIKNISVNDFILDIIKYNNVNEILDAYNKSQSNVGFVFERLYDIIIKFGFCDKFKNIDYYHLIGNANNGKLKKLENLDEYLNEKISSGNSGGCSDITLKNKKTNEYIFITSKYPKSKEDIKKEKSVEYYDIQNIIAMAANNNKIYKNYDIYLVVPDRKKLLIKVKKANNSSEYITKYMTEYNILDKSDLNKYFLEFKADILKNIINNKINVNKYLESKEKLKLRFHQELITYKTSKLIEESNKTFLWGCKCRSGKTYMVGGLIIKQFDLKKKLNVLIITPAPTETAPQFTEDLFNKFSDFTNFKIHNVENSKYLDKLELEENNIFVMSKQLLQKYTNENAIKKIKELKLDIIAFDENHFSGTTNLSKDILNTYSAKNTVKIYLTATYSKPLQEWNIPVENQMFWDIEDENICKSIIQDGNNISKLKDKHGLEYIDKTINTFKNIGQETQDIFKSYESMPELHIMTNMFDSQRYEILKEKLNKENKIGFCYETLFTLNKNKTQFIYPKEVKTILRYISGSNKEEDGFKTIYPRIDKLLSEKESRQCFTQIWFLPSDNINETSECLKKIMLEDKVLKKYDIMCINRKNTELAKDVKDEISKKEIEARESGKTGLILLAGNMLSLGITLNLCDVVILMNNTLSCDKVFQQMYRCMTEGNNKKIGIVVDMNISRVINTITNYTVYKKDLTIEKKIEYLIDNKLINIDVDMMLNKEINTEKIVNKMIGIWKSDPINSFKILLRNLENEYIEFDTSTQKLINEAFIHNHKKNKIKMSILLKDDEDEKQEINSGLNKIKEDTTEDNKSNSSTEEKKQEIINISFVKEVLPSIIPLICILTMKNTNTDFIQILNDIKENPELLETFNDQCLIWWNKKDLIELIKEISEKYINKNSNVYNIVMVCKTKMRSLIDNPDKLLELINECLKPKEIEKRQFGEVFTPIEFINNKMLKDLEEYWLNTYKENIYENESLKWYDPAAGMGNYHVAIYYKLYDGLKNKIPDEKKRKRHIIEKQLYFGELNKKNITILKQIFNINNKYKLNLYEGETLNVDIEKEFKVKEFDIIIGNPPYNEEFKGLNGYASPLYHKFIEYYLNKCKLISYIIPSRWFVGGRGLDKFRENMLNRNDIVYINHYDNACEIFGNEISIKGGINYFLIDKNYNGLCKYNKKEIKLSNFDILIDSKYLDIIKKIENTEKITNIYCSKGYYGVSLTDKRLNKNKKNDSDILCYVSQQKGYTTFIENDKIKLDKYNSYKLITPSASFGANSGFGNLIIAGPNEIHSESYISFKTNSLQETEYLSNYLKTRFASFFLSLRKNTQNISSNTCEWIPLPPLNKNWSDEELYKYYKFSIEDINLIKNEKIIGLKELNDKKEDKKENKKPVKKIKIKKPKEE